MTTHPISIESAGGEYMETVLVISWSVKPGEKIKPGDLLVTVETAKAATEIEADRDGWLAEIHYGEGQEASVGAVLGTISDVEPQAPSVTAPQPVAGAPAAPVAGPAVVFAAEQEVAPANGRRIVASPLARRLAIQAGIELATVTGSGPDGRIKQRDILKAIELRAGPELGPSALAQSASGQAQVAAPSLQKGQGALPVVLLHGFGADRSAWRQVLPLMEPGIETITIDLPGHGMNADQQATSIQDLALFVSERLESDGIEQAHVVGHSLGGATALALSAVGRIALRSLTLLAPGGLGPEISGGFIAGLTQSNTPAALERWLSFMLADSAALPNGYAAAVLRQMEKLGNRPALERLAGHLFSDNTQLFDGRPALSRLDIPTRIVWGRSDRVIPCGHALEAPDFAAVHLLAGVGHVPQMENPKLTARLIMETIRSAGA